MTLKMVQDDKSAVVEAPTYIVTQSPADVSSGSSKKGIQKKHVLIGVGLVVLAGLIIAGILVGMYIFAEAQKEIIKYSLNFKSTQDGGNVKQDVVSDPNDNVVMYHVTKDGKRVDIINDFNKGMQIVKMESDYGTNCYVSALNHSAAMDPSQITGPEQDSKPGDNTNGGATLYTVSTIPISDRSFLPKKAQEMCKSVSVYWAYRSCGGEDDSVSRTRQRRTVCITSCGIRVCSCRVRLVQTWIGGRVYCNFYFGC